MRVAFVIGQNVTEVGRRWILIAAAVAAAFVGLWSLVEVFGWEPVALAGTAGRPVGPLGSSAYLGAAAALLAGVGGALGGRRPHSCWSRSPCRAPGPRGPAR